MRTRPPVPVLLSAVAVLASARAQAQFERWPDPTVITDVRLEPDPVAPRHALLLEDGRIRAVLPADAQLPPGFRRVDGQGYLCLPGFIDAYSHAGCAQTAPVAEQDRPVSPSEDVYAGMREANRNGIAPSFRAAEALALAPEDSERWRKAGFGALLSAPHGEILAGTSVLATTRDAAARDVILRADVFMQAAFQASGPGYPGTTMACMAQLRQFVGDARWISDLVERFDNGRRGPRPPWDKEIAAAQALLSGEQRLLCEAQSARDIERWNRLGAELGLRTAVAGGLEAWRARDELAFAQIPVILTLDWGEEPKDPNEKKEAAEEPEGEAPASEQPPDASAVESPAGPPGQPEDPRLPAVEAVEQRESDEDLAASWRYDEPEAVRVERRRLWEEGRDCALRLTEAKVAFAFGTAGDRPAKLLERVQQLIEAGLTRDAALAALTTRAAEVTGVARRLGRIAPGYDATFALWTADPLAPKAKDAKKAQVAWMFVDGWESKFEVEEKKERGNGAAPDPGLDLDGEWDLVLHADEDRHGTATIEMEPDGAVVATFNWERRGGGMLTTEFTGRLSGNELLLEGDAETEGMSFAVELEAEVEAERFEGTVHLRSERFEFDMEIEATRKPGAAHDRAGHEHATAGARACECFPEGEGR